MRRRLLISLALALAPSLVLVSLARATAPSAGSADAGSDGARFTLDAGAQPPEASTYVAPDPPPLITKDQWVFDLRWDRGDVYLVAVHPLELPAPQATPRAIGRFAIELTEGRTLLERVRFDFPFLGVPEPDAGIRFSRRLMTRIGVMFPQSKRGNLLELVDRATGQRWKLPWPPELLATDAGPGGVRTHD